jgi:hypothetical protein
MPGAAHRLHSRNGVVDATAALVDGEGVAARRRRSESLSIVLRGGQGSGTGRIVGGGWPM